MVQAAREGHRQWPIEIGAPRDPCLKPRGPLMTPEANQDVLLDYSPLDLEARPFLCASLSPWPPSLCLPSRSLPSLWS